uniref:prenyltransferase n=1 Tax=Ningiella ruwaisensis TaxID=2364274 RepID=UPI00109FFD1C|nr:prenyltransferase [Ningiella ruwaisensis]
MSLYVSTIWESARPKFLVLAPICVGVSLAYASAQNIALSHTLAILCILLALCAHISVNLLNEYQDAKSGLDDSTVRTPFSGGSGALQKNPQALDQVKTAGLLFIVVSVLLGISIVMLVGSDTSRIGLIILGLVGVMIVGTYTPYINQSALLCLCAPGAGFGFIMVVGSYIALTETISLNIILLSLALCCLVNNLLLLNQFPDAKADARAGRRHLVVQLGFKTSAFIYFLNIILSFIIIAWLIYAKVLSMAALFLFIGLPLGLLVAFRAMHFHDDKLSTFIPFMAMNVLLCLLVPAGIIVDLILSA